MGIGFGTGLLVGDNGVEIRIDHHVKVPDQEAVTGHDLLNEAGQTDDGGDTDSLGQHTNLTIGILLADGKPDDISEIYQCGV